MTAESLGDLGTHLISHENCHVNTLIAVGSQSLCSQGRWRGHVLCEQIVFAQFSHSLNKFLVRSLFTLLVNDEKVQLAPFLLDSTAFGSISKVQDAR